MIKAFDEEHFTDDGREDKYIQWMEMLPRYYTAGNPRFHDIYYDGESHYYIDGTVLDSGVIPVLMVDTDTDKYYRLTETGNWLILPYDEEN